MSGDFTLGDGVGRSALRGAAVGFVFMVSLAVTIGLLGGLPSNNALGIAAFAAVWVGPGFGVLFGAIFAISRNERLEAATVEATLPTGQTG